MTKRATSEQIRERAVLCLLQQPTLAKAAAAAGISLRTLQRWLADDSFQKQYRAAKSDLLTHATARLRAASGKAVTVLAKIAGDPKASSAARVSASRTVLELAQRAEETEEIERRIRALEMQNNDSQRL